MNQFKAIDEILWNETLGTWVDYDIINNKSRPYFSSTNLTPLFTGCFNRSDSPRIAEKTLKYIEDLKLDR